MAIGIELDGKLPGVRGQHAQGTGYVPSVANGIGAAVGEALGNLPTAALAANFHTKVEAINKLDLDNQAAEAELAFDRWNAKAMFGSNGEAPTTLAAFDGEKDDIARATRLNGLMNLQGMEAGNAAGMYSKASETALGDILGALSPQARLAVRDRLLSKRNDTLTRMERHGFTQREAAVRATNAALMEARARRSAEQAALEAKRVEDDFAGREKEINDEYQTTMANMDIEEVYNARSFGPKPSYEVYKEEWGKMAAKNRDGALAALALKRAEAVAKIGGAYGISTEGLLEQQRKAILDGLGVSEKDVAGNPRLSEAVEGQLAAYKSKLGGTLIESMIDTGLLSFAEDALEDDTRLISDYGITDVRVRTALREKLDYAKTQETRKQIQKNEMVALEVSRAGLLAADGVNYEYPTEHFVKLRDEAQNAKDYAAAAKYNDVIAMRHKAEAGAAELAKRQGYYLQIDEVKSFLDQIVLSQSDFYDIRLEDGTVYPIHRAALAKHLVWNYLGLDSEAKKKAYFDSLNIPNGGGRDLRSMNRVLSGSIGELGLMWQATKERVSGQWMLGEGTGDIYPVSTDPRNAHLFTQDKNGDFVPNDASAMGRLGIPMEGAEDGVQWLSKQEFTSMLSTLGDLARAYVEANPQATDAQIDDFVYKALKEMTTGTDQISSIKAEGQPLLGRQAAFMEYTEELERLAEKGPAILRTMSLEQLRTNTNARERKGK